jgi:hypothetical protein
MFAATENAPSVAANWMSALHAKPQCSRQMPSRVLAVAV